jgi:DNA-binding CsgD family transcriptional regulator
MVAMAWPPGKTPFVGRHAELALLQALWQEAKGGSGGVVLIGGEPGVGKSRLVRELAASVRSAGAVSGVAAAYEGEPGKGFEPVIELLRGLAKTAPAAGGPAVSNALAALSEPRSSDQGSSGRGGLFENVLTAIETVGASAAGALLIIEDLHWADESTARLLTYIGRRSSDLPLLVLGTHRPIGTNPPPGLLALSAEVRRFPHGLHVGLQPLTPEESLLLVESAARDSLAPAVAQRIAQRSEGNPFFIEELVREAVAAKVQAPDELVVPAAVAEVVQQRLAGLPPVTRSVAAGVAVLGESASLDRVAALLGLPHGEVLPAIDELSAVGILEPADVPRLGFRHALAREAVYRSIPLARRCALHQAAAQLLADDADGSPAVIASHLLVSGRDNVRQRAADLLSLAASRSFAALAFEDAVRHGKTALGLLRATGAGLQEQLRLQLVLAEAHRRSGDSEDALTVFRGCADLAASLGEPGQEAEAACGYERTFVATSRPRSDPDALSVALLSRALDHLPPGRDVTRSRLLSALANAEFFRGEASRAEQLSGEALQLARGSGDLVALASALEARRIVAWGPGELEERLAIAGELADVAAAANTGEWLLDGLSWQVACLVEKGAIDEAARAIARYDAIARELHSPQHLADSLKMQGMIALLRGDLVEGKRLAEAALRQGLRAGTQDAVMYHLTQMIEVWEGGAARELIEERLRNPRLWPQTPARLPMLAYLQARLGRLDEAERSTAKLAEDGFTSIPRDWMYLPLTTLLCDAVVRMGRRDWAEQLYGLLLPYADQFVVNSNSNCYGSVELSLGMAASVTGDSRVEGHLRRAIARNAAIGAPVWVARAKEALGRLLLNQPRRLAEARGLLEEAAVAFTAVGLPRAAETAAAVAASEPAPEPQVEQPPAGLSGREADVLRLIAAGCSNHDIAARLFLSVRTVERHVTNIYDKIGAGGRAQAIAFALRHNLTD